MPNYKITIKDHTKTTGNLRQYTGTFQGHRVIAMDEAIAYYAEELNTTPDNIEIVSVIQL